MGTRVIASRGEMDADVMVAVSKWEEVVTGGGVMAPAETVGSRAAGNRGVASKAAVVAVAGGDKWLTQPGFRASAP